MRSEGGAAPHSKGNEQQDQRRERKRNPFHPDTVPNGGGSVNLAASHTRGKRVDALQFLEGGRMLTVAGVL